MPNIDGLNFLFISATFVIFHIKLDTINREVICWHYVCEAEKIICWYMLQRVSVPKLIPEEHQIGCCTWGNLIHHHMLRYTLQIWPKEGKSTVMHNLLYWVDVQQPYQQVLSQPQPPSCLFLFGEAQALPSPAQRHGQWWNTQCSWWWQGAHWCQEHRHPRMVQDTLVQWILWICWWRVVRYYNFDLSGFYFGCISINASVGGGRQGIW